MSNIWLPIHKLFRMGSLNLFQLLLLLPFRWIPGQLDFIFSGSAQSVVCSVGRIHNVLKVTFCFMHATSAHYHHYTDLLICIEHMRWKILVACVNAFGVYSVEGVSKMKLVLSVTFLIFITIYSVVCVKLAHSSLSDREDISITFLIIIIKSEVSIFPIFFVVVCLGWLCYHMLSVS